MPNQEFEGVTLKVPKSLWALVLTALLGGGASGFFLSPAIDTSAWTRTQQRDYSIVVDKRLDKLEEKAEDCQQKLVQLPPRALLDRVKAIEIRQTVILERIANVQKTVENLRQ